MWLFPHQPSYYADKVYYPPLANLKAILDEVKAFGKAHSLKGKIDF